MDNLFSNLFDLQDCCFRRDCLSSLAKLTDIHCNLDNLCVPLFTDTSFDCLVCNGTKDFYQDIVENYAEEILIRVVKEGGCILKEPRKEW